MSSVSQADRMGRGYRMCSLKKHCKPFKALLIYWPPVTTREEYSSLCCSNSTDSILLQPGGEYDMWESSISHTRKHDSLGSGNQQPPKVLRGCFAALAPSWLRAASWQSMLILLTHPHPSH